MKNGFCPMDPDLEPVLQCNDCKKIFSNPKNVSGILKIILSAVSKDKCPYCGSKNIGSVPGIMW